MWFVFVAKIAPKKQLEKQIGSKFLWILFSRPDAWFTSDDTVAIDFVIRRTATITTAIILCILFIYCNKTINIKHQRSLSVRLCASASESNWIELQVHDAPTVRLHRRRRRCCGRNSLVLIFISSLYLSAVRPYISFSSNWAVRLVRSHYYSSLYRYYCYMHW